MKLTVMKETSFRIVMAMLLLTGGLQAQATYSLDGRVRSTGRGLPGVPVTITRLADTPDDRRLLTRVVLTDAAGVYTISNLPAGNYRVCPEMPRSQYLSPCAWGPRWPTVRVSGRDLTGKLDVNMDRGTLVVMKVTDQDGELSRNPDKRDALELGCKGGRGETVAAWEQLKIGAVRYYTVVVPRGSAQELVMRSSVGNIEHDNAGSRRAVTDGAPLSLTAGAGEEAREISLVVRKK